MFPNCFHSFCDHRKIFSFVTLLAEGCLWLALRTTKKTVQLLPGFKNMVAIDYDEINIVVILCEKLRFLSKEICDVMIKEMNVLSQEMTFAILEQFVMI